MKLIIDGGASRIKAAILSNEGTIHSFEVSGINLNIDTTESLIQKMNQWPINKTNLFDEIHFYLAGYSPIHEKKIYDAIIKAQIFASQYFFYSDLLAAARGTLGKESGIICILGTGSNTGLYNGEKITKKVNSLGYLLGDEGSGFSIGKSILKKYFRKELPDEQQNALNNYLLDRIGIRELPQIYALPYPNATIAQVCEWASEYQQKKNIKSIVKEEFKHFYNQNLAYYEDLHQNLVFVGSIAYYFQEILKKSIPDDKFKIAQIVREPMEGLIAYHKHSA